MKEVTITPPEGYEVDKEKPKEYIDNTSFPYNEDLCTESSIDEELKQASIEWKMANNPMCIGGGVFSAMINQLNISTEFIAGAQWERKRQKNQWKDVNTELPNIKEEVLIKTKLGFHYIGYLKNKTIFPFTKKLIWYLKGNGYASIINPVTHWMPIP